MKNLFPIITTTKQQEFEKKTTYSIAKNIPCICGYFGRACRQMNKEEGANRMICFSCPLAEFVEKSKD